MKPSPLQSSAVIDRLSWIFLLACYSALAWIVINTSGRILDGDASGELVLSNLLSRENAIISRNWFYSTELRVLNTQLIYAPLFKVFSGWQMVRITGTLILNLILVISYLFMMRQTQVIKSACLISAGLLLLPPSVAQVRIVNIHTYYIPHISIGFVLIGLLLLFNKKTTRQGRLISAALFIALSFISGLGGVRQLMITLAPLALGLLLLAFRSVDNNTPSTDKGLMRLVQNGPLMLSGVGLIANLAGIIINETILRRVYSFGDQIKTHFAEFSIQRGVDVLNAFLRLLGFRQGSRLFSQMGILSFAAVCMTALLLIYAVKVQKNYRSLSRQAFSYDSGYFLWFFFSASFAVNTLLFVLTDAFFFELYYIPVMVMIVPLTATMIDRRTTPFTGYQQVIAALFVCSMLTGGIYSGYFLLERPRERSVTKYGGLTYDNIHLADDLQAPIEFLMKNGYRQGFSTFWHANTIRELSNGEIICTGIFFPEMAVYPWLLEKTEAQPQFGRGTSFLLLSASEYNTNMYRTDKSTAIVNYGTIAYSDPAFVVITFQDDNLVQKILHN